jgi:chitin synthase
VIRIATVGSVGCYFLAAALHGEFSAIALTFFQYMFMLPTYMNIFAIYSFCNIHDISWGTKGNDDASSGGHGGVGVDTSLGAGAGLDHEQAEANRKQQELMVKAAAREKAMMVSRRGGVGVKLVRFGAGDGM